MKNILFFVLFFLVSLQSYSQIIPEIEADYISTVSGKKYSGIIIRNDNDTVTIFISTRKLNILKPQIDTLEKRKVVFPFIKDCEYSEIKLASLETIRGNILEMKYSESLRFVDISNGKIYDLKWNQFTGLKTMDPDYLKYDVITPTRGGKPVKGEFNSVTDNQRFIFTELNGKPLEYYFQNTLKIYLRHPDQFQLPKQFRKDYNAQKPLKPFVTLGGGFSIPINSSEGSGTDGNSGLGFNLNLDFHVPMGSYFLFGFSLCYQSLENEVKDAAGWKIESENWSNIWVLGGPILTFNRENSMIFFSAQGGMLFSSFPKITSTLKTQYKTYQEILTGESEGKFALGFGAGFGTDKFIFSVKYLNSKPEFTLNSSAVSGEGKAEVEFSIISFSFGFRL